MDRPSPASSSNNDFNENDKYDEKLEMPVYILNMLRLKFVDKALGSDDEDNANGCSTAM